MGLRNYAQLLRDDAFLTSMRNTILLTIPHVLLRIGLALALALALNSKIRFRGFYRALYFLPVLTMPVATGTVCRWLYNLRFGLINYGLGRSGLPQPAWLAQPGSALVAVLVVLLRSGVGYDMGIYLAGLQCVPHAY